MENNPKILHRIYFDNFAPYHDPYLHYLDSWHRELPDYTVMRWNASNLDVHANEWTEIAWREKNPVFLAEYFRWQVLSEYGGVYLDADCEILNGANLRKIIDELFAQDEYDIFFGVEEYNNGHPTAQSMGAKKGSDLVAFMKQLYERSLPNLWHWRNTHGLIGPQLMALYFLKNNINTESDGFFKKLNKPTISGRSKVYPQEYFSPKFSLLGDTLNYDAGKTCVYHMFANANIDFGGNRKKNDARQRALTFSQYREHLAKTTLFPRELDLTELSLRAGRLVDERVKADDVSDLISFGPYISLARSRYVVTITFDVLPTRGAIELAVTHAAGAEMLANIKRQWNEVVESKLSLAFEVTSDVAQNIEFLVTGHAIDHVSISAMIVDIAKKADPTGRPSRSHLRLLHRIYFGFDGKPDIFGRYLDTWKTQLPDFEIVHWNASNLPMDINPYVRTLHKEKDHAFLTDYFRWWVLREYGGTYLDADVEVLDGNIYRRLIEELSASHQFDAFIGIDEKDGGWYTAHSMASKPQSAISRFMCNVYDDMDNFAVWRKKGFYFWAPQLTALYFANQGHNPDGMGTSPGLQNPRIISNVKIYPQEWFAPLAPTGNQALPFKLNALSKNNCLCHHFACSWHNPESPYLAHAIEKGGQANVLFADLVAAAARESVEISASKLSIGVGRRAGNAIKTTGNRGCLLYGPYIELKAGRYIVRYAMNSIDNSNGLSVDIVGDCGDTFIARELVKPSEILDKTFRFAFELKRDTQNVEFRIFVEKDTALEVQKIFIDHEPR